ncbi:CDP-glycerol glycerophosphotransferase family protein [Arthrobacter sp. I2-34]|uniref:CDP-glycerol glycerophosphotransferase family protein n=1 Tax=Arthrobacter hankyongi TaxID=2904801 RepID=A0ABS9L6G0_9MICC|nr:CDP-glycerol glycerophosphotransferase family protein [Arthrobacter hankyongi]MCG2622253.1 CDP-glycerol glycerophosphotransferase family protein [Arthrobacter hankyongi]
MTAAPSPRSLLLAARRRAERILDPDANGARRELHRLAVSQQGTQVSVHLRLSAALTPVAVWIRSGEDLVRLAGLHPAAQGTIPPLVQARAPEPGDGHTGEEYSAVIRLEDFPAVAVQPDDGGVGAVLPMLLEVRAAADRLPRYATDITAEDGVSRGFVLLGRFRRTTVGPLRPVTAGTGAVLAPYVNRRGFFRLAVDRPLKPYNAIYVKRLSVAGGVVRLAGRLRTRHGEAARAELVLVGRQSGTRYTVPARVVLDDTLTQRHFGLREYRLSARLELAAMPDDALARDGILDAWLEVHDRGTDQPHRVRIGRTRYLVRKLTRPGWQNRGERTLCIIPYYTFKAKRTSFHIELLDTAAFSYLQEHTRGRLARRHHGRQRAGRPVWLVGEQPYKAQDTGLAFFRYLRSHHPEIEAYYVIDPHSPEARNLEGLGNVLAYRSKEHVEAALRAERFIGSHHPDFLYPTRLPQFRRAARGVKVFLQHGVMGTKWMVPNYGRNSPDFETDLFLVSSDREKEYIVSDFGYPPEQVAVTGLSRFDTLFAGDVPVKPNQILVIPTWRDWLQDPDRFAESEYLRAWTGLLQDPRLAALAKEHGAELVFCLHPNMQQFRAYFDGVPARVISQGEVDVQHLLKQSALLVTDYSSVGFDFSFLDKPVLYYQFDRERFLGPEGSHLDLDTELPGRIAFDRNRLLDLLREALAAGCTMPPEYQRRARRFLKYRDRDNCRRIFDAVLGARPAASGLRAGTVPEVVEMAGRRLRRSRFYFPAMRRLFGVVSRTPVDENLVVFESGLGTQYADSPRYLYEQLVQSGDQRRKVWIYHRKLPRHDPRTKVVRRLSPGYFWYLARAKYWVNNQNFPYYLRRRRNGVFIQTWHGTPLKRMLHDLEQFHGRDEDYLGRVNQAVRQWSVLLSPSSYATGAFRSAFGYSGPVLEEGYPRNDVLARGRQAEAGNMIRERLGIPHGKRVVLYAPTFRDDQSVGTGRFGFKLPLDLEDFQRRFGADTVLLLRMHVLVAGQLDIPEGAAGCVRDVSAYPEVQELLLASDVLVTDYSSVLFDFAILRRPIVFYAYDLAHYRNTLRGFYLDYGSQLPGPVVQTQDELFEALADAAAPDPGRGRRLEEFAARFAPKDDGGAARRIVDLLLPPLPPRHRPGADDGGTLPPSSPLS